MKKVVVFGTGKIYEVYKPYLVNNCVIMIIDNDKGKQGTCLDNVIICPVEEIKQISYDYILLFSTYKEEMRLQLQSFNIPNEKIIDYEQFSYYEHIQAIAPSSFFHCDISAFLSEKIVLLVGHELSNSGAPIVLFYLAKILKKNGYYPIFLVFRGGGLMEEIEMENMPYIISLGLSPEDERVNQLVKGAKFILFNTNVVQEVIPYFYEYNQNIGWWLHESDMLYQGFYLKEKTKNILNNIQIFSVSNVAKDSFKRYVGEVDEIQNLMFGIPDKKQESMKQLNKVKAQKDKVIFSIIGTWGERKGQDILLKALELLSEEEREKIQLWRIGTRSNAEKFQKIEDNMIKLLKDNWIDKGALSIEEVSALYTQMDVVIVPSREETVSAVAMEGLMHGCLCILSDVIGIAEYITHGVNGLLFQTESAESLAKAIRWSISQDEGLEQMRINARKTYEREFSLGGFEQRIRKAIKIIEEKVV